MSFWSAQIPKFWLSIAAALVLGAGGAVAYWLWLPARDEALTGMWTARAAVYRDLKENRTADALQEVRAWRGIVRKLPTILWLSPGEQPAGTIERLTLLDKCLAELEGALIANREELLPAAAARCFEAHRQCVALFNQTPDVQKLPAEPDPGHQHGVHQVAEGEPVPEIQLEIVPDPKSGWNLHIATSDFRFSPLNASAQHVPGEGHGHLYIDGKKITRLYGEWYYIGSLGPGRHDIKVTLNTNNHNDLYHGGQPIAAQAEIVVRDGTEFVYFQTSTGDDEPLLLSDEELCRIRDGQPVAAPQPKN